MTIKSNLDTVPIPARMRELERDARGYPIPVTVLRDSTGRPHFTINDEAQVTYYLFSGKCGICGQALTSYNFIGGPKSAFHPHGGYIDIPGHKQCLEYAVQVCPFLAMQSYNRRIDASTLPPEEARKLHQFTDPTMDPARPKVNVLITTSDITIVDQDEGMKARMIVPRRPLIGFTFWLDGKKISYAKGKAIVREHYPELKI